VNNNQDTVDQFGLPLKNLCLCCLTHRMLKEQAAEVYCRAIIICSFYFHCQLHLIIGKFFQCIMSVEMLACSLNLGFSSRNRFW